MPPIELAIAILAAYTETVKLHTLTIERTPLDVSEAEARMRLEDRQQCRADQKAAREWLQKLWNSFTPKETP